MPSIFDSLLGQQDAPDLQVPSSQSILSQIYKSIPKMTEATVDYNKRLAPGMAEAQRMGEDVYDPWRGRIRDLSGQMIFEQLGMGGELPPDVSAAIRQAGFEQGALTGTGTSNASGANVARNLGLTSLDLLNNRIGRGATYGSNTANLWQPQSLGIDPAGAGSLFAGQVNQQNAINKYYSDLDFQNTMNLLNRPLELGGKVGNIAGQVVGGVFGTNMGGGVMSAMGGMGGGGGAPFGSYGGTMSNSYPGTVVPAPAYS